MGAANRPEMPKPPADPLPYLAWAIHEGDGVYRYGGRTRQLVGRLKLADGWTRPVEPGSEPPPDVYFTIALAVRKAWSDGDGSFPERVRVDDLRYRIAPPAEARAQPRPEIVRPEVVRSGRLRRPDTKPMSLREIAEREAPGWKPPRD